MNNNNFFIKRHGEGDRLRSYGQLISRHPMSYFFIGVIHE